MNTAVAGINFFIIGVSIVIDERRRDSRRPLDYDVTCYIDGARLDAHALNVSQRGAFVGTELGRPVPVGALAGLVFISDSTSVGTTFLFGRVIRQQDVPIRGFAVRWEKAVSAGRTNDLKSFLNQFLGVEDAVVEEELVGPSGSSSQMSRCVYRFEPFDPAAADAPGNQDIVDSIGYGRRVIRDSMADPSPDPFAVTGLENVLDPISIEVEFESDQHAGPAGFSSAPHSSRHRSPGRSRQGRAGMGELESFIGNLDVSEEEISAVRIGGHASPIHLPPAAVVGPAVLGALPDVLSVPDSVACEMEGAVIVAGSKLDVVVTGLSMGAAVVRSRFMPIDPDSGLILELTIGSRKGVSTVLCHGRVTGLQRGAESGFVVTFGKIDEGESVGIFERYLKWLKFNGAV